MALLCCNWLTNSGLIALGLEMGTISMLALAAPRSRRREHVWKVEVLYPMKRFTPKLLLVGVLLVSSALVSAAKDDIPYKEGPVCELTYIKIKPGMFDAYVSWLASDWKKVNDEYKKAGIILDAQVYSARARNPHEADLILCVTYKNMAALDNLDDKTSSIDEKFWGTRQKANDASIGREKMREVLGSELVQELQLK